MPPIALTDYQLRLVRQAAATMPVSGCDEFLRGVARHLGNEPTDEAVIAAIDGRRSTVSQHSCVIAQRR
jgi:hypothetical protein